MGLPTLARLRRGGDVGVWPFDRWTGAPIVLAEIWPGLIEPAVQAALGASDIRDAIQVRLLAAALSRLTATELAEMMHAAPDIAREEAWILGVTGQAA